MDTAQTSLNTYLADHGEAVAHHAPWPRFRVGDEGWLRTAEALGRGDISLFALWADADEIHMAVVGLATTPIVLSCAAVSGQFPSVARHHAPAIRPERAITDLWGHRPVGSPDTRPWLDHGVWQGGTAAPYRFLPVEGEGLHQIPVGPVHAGIIEPGHFRFTAHGETVVRLEERLGYVHKGTERLMAGADLAAGAKLCARVSGDSTVAYGIAFAQAAEAALGIAVPDRALLLRALMAELERLANHFGDVGAICNDAAFALMHAHTGVLREAVLEAADRCFGHRLMMDRVVPGGVATDLAPDGADILARLLDRIDRALPRLVEIYDNTASLKDRAVGTGLLKPGLAHRFAAGGFVGRASARDFDSRRNLAYAPYDRLSFTVPVLKSGDVNARVWVRIEEIRQSVSLVRQCLALFAGGPVAVPLPEPAGEVREGCGVAEGFRGDVFVWLRLGGDGRILRCFPRDPSWFQWPLLEAVIEGNIVADFPLCNKSFNCSYSGHDL